LKIVSDATSDPFFNMVPPGTHAAEIAHEILVHKHHKHIDMYAKKLNTGLVNIFEENNRTSSSISTMMNKYHLATVSPHINSSFIDFLTGLGIPISAKYGIGPSLLFQFILRNSFRELLMLHNKQGIVELKDSFDLSKLKLTSVEEKILRYVAGYIPYSIHNHFRRVKSTPESILALKIVDMWNRAGVERESLSLLEYTTNEWVEKVNRGGLFLVTDNFYRLIVRIEITARTVLNTQFLSQYAGEDMQVIILEKLKCDPIVIFGWNSLTRNIENKNLCDCLKLLIFKKWIAIRAYSFVRAWVDKVKHNSSKADAKAQPSLRKVLGK